MQAILSQLNNINCNYINDYIFLTMKYKFRNFIKDIVCLLSLVILISCTEDIEASIPPSQSVVSISGTLPVLYIDTENHSPIVSKEEYLNASYWLDPMSAEGIEPLGSEIAPLSMQIR